MHQLGPGRNWTDFQPSAPMESGRLALLVMLCGRAQRGPGKLSGVFGGEVLTAAWEQRPN